MSDQLPSTTGDSFADAADSNFVPTAAGNNSFLQFGKDGSWTVDDEVVTGSKVIVQSKLIAHGWMLWTGAGNPPIEAFDFITKGPRPAAMDSEEGLDNDGRPTTFRPKEALQFFGKFTGDDEDLGQFKFATCSMGGVKETDAFFKAIIAQARKSKAYFYPVVELAVDSYKHTKWGKIYFPVYNIVDWADENGVLEADAVKAIPKKEEAAAEDDAPPKRRRKRA
jgi:hypothetical protein